MSDTTKEKTVPVTSQEVRELSKAIFKAFNQNIQPYAEPCMAKVDALIQSHIDQVVAPLREALVHLSQRGCAYETGKLQGINVCISEGIDRSKYCPACYAKSSLSASPIPGAKAEETAGAAGCEACGVGPGGFCSPCEKRGFGLSSEEFEKVMAEHDLRTKEQA